MNSAEAGPDAEYPEIWGGVECTVNRVGDRYFDQTVKTGHADRPGDLEKVAALGIKTLRYPVLWEIVAPARPGECDWSFTDARLGILRTLGMRPIAGLLHHGSGPRYTGPLDPAFPELFADYAGRVARRYPWIDMYTPINEPLTTARFMGLYGHWHPHGRSDAIFIACLLAQCRAVVLAMRAIRAVNPAAKLIQTEDLGKVHATPPLAGQADFENGRRWLATDLLCGKVGRDHPLRNYLAQAGAPERILEDMGEQPCRPDILGWNHYLTSERFLDHRLERYPANLHGGNGRQAYADVEAVRACEPGPAGPGRLLREAWDRFQSPMAVTEVHLGCTREDQLRWLREVWESARGLIREGVDIRAVTVWSMFGSCDWSSLATRNEGDYEPGVFDVRSPEPRPTALAAMISRLVRREPPQDPLSGSPGWWKRRERLHYHPPYPLSQADPQRPCINGSITSRPILITGSGGTLGRAFARACRDRGLTHVGVSRGDLDIADRAAVDAALAGLRPWAVINAAGYVRVDDAECDTDRCRRDNALGPALLAQACAVRGIRFLTFSSDLVFDGSSARPYLESDPVGPLSAYGRSKAEAESLVRERAKDALIVRTSAFFGPHDSHNFLVRTLASLRKGERLVAGDEVVSPTYVPDLTRASLDLLVDGAEGIWHLANRGAFSWAALARIAAERLGMDSEVCVPDLPAAANRAAPRPRYSALGSERAWLLPSFEHALERCLQALSEGGGLSLDGRIESSILI